MIVRQANIKDFEIIQNFAKQAADLHVENKPDIFKCSPVLIKSDFKKILKDKYNFILVAEINGKAAGYCKLRIATAKSDILVCRTFAFIDEFFVDEKFRRQGIGTAFFNEIQSFSKSKGAKSIELYVWSFNEPAKKLYESLGMKPQRTVMELKI